MKTSMARRREQHADSRLRWIFPLPRPHTGILLGNGTQGLMIWGFDDTLCVTVARAGFWDHRFGNTCLSRTTYRQLRALLETRDEAGIVDVFGRRGGSHPCQMGGGRLTVKLPDGWRLREGWLDTRTATVAVTATRGARTAAIEVKQAAHSELSWLLFPKGWLDKVDWRWVPAWTLAGAAMPERGCREPSFRESGTAKSFHQPLPKDPGLTCSARRMDDRLAIQTCLGGEETLPPRIQGATFSRAASRSSDWWSAFWNDAPSVSLPDPELQEIVEYGLYKLACSTAPGAPACTLQGPFMEDYQIPPWSNDYHFNINVQMIYLPLLAANRLEHFAPLWTMLEAWLGRIRAYGKAFFESDEALMLPHAVDDRGQVIGSFWTGSIDHGCTAWMAHLAWQYYLYSLDRDFLERLAWPLLQGAFGGYWAMMEPDGKGGLCLPVSVSPEFKGARMDAWGRNASFQLAACHAVVRALGRAAAILGKPVDPRWSRVEHELPPYQTLSGPTSLESPETHSVHIALWEGHDLNTSHRHHSHLAGIFPFCTVNPRAADHAEIVTASLRHWTQMGPGSWSGWCVPWAATIWARCDQPDPAVAWLHWWAENFVNEGRGTLHNAAFRGTTLLEAFPPLHRRPRSAQIREVMQLDAGMGALTAVFELLVQCREDGIHILPGGLPRGWRECSFDRIRTEGAFLVGATVSGGIVIETRVTSLKGGMLRLHHGLGESWSVNGKPGTGPVLERVCGRGEKLALRSAAV